MNEVEAHIALRRPSLLDSSLELSEECPRRGLSLNKPAIVEAHLGLCEQNRGSLSWCQEPVAGKQHRIMLQDVSQGQVVVSNHISFSIPIVRSMLRLDLWKDGTVLHDIMDGGERQHSNGPLRHQGQLAIYVSFKNSSADHQVSDFLPIHGAQELCLLFSNGCIIPLCRLHSHAARLIYAICNQILAIDVQPHEGKHCVESAQGALILFTASVAGSHMCSYQV
mmetsp:Transcript_62334/g.148826  ORF Transcript_62334/g.148826 Transcript_62334/m.148826 type:complete len:223 (-) Transcript_62334:583-1251(-)